MTQKRLEKGSVWEKADTNGDNIITDNEIALRERMIRIENQDKKEDQQRIMVWFSAISVTAFIVVLMLPIVPLDRLALLSSIASTRVISNSGILVAFIAAKALKKNGENKQ